MTITVYMKIVLCFTWQRRGNFPLNFFNKLRLGKYDKKVIRLQIFVLLITFKD